MGIIYVWLENINRMGWCKMKEKGNVFYVIGWVICIFIKFDK